MLSKTKGGLARYESTKIKPDEKSTSQRNELDDFMNEMDLLDSPMNYNVKVSVPVPVKKSLPGILRIPLPEILKRPLTLSPRKTFS